MFDVEVTIAHSEGAPYRLPARDAGEAQRIVAQLLAAWGRRLHGRANAIVEALEEFGTFESEPEGAGFRILIKRAAA